MSKVESKIYCPKSRKSFSVSVDLEEIEKGQPAVVHCPYSGENHILYLHNLGLEDKDLRLMAHCSDCGQSFDIPVYQNCSLFMI